MPDETATLREALARIAFPEESDVDGLSGNPCKWPSTIAYHALGGRYLQGMRLDSKKTLTESKIDDDYKEWLKEAGQI